MTGADPTAGIVLGSRARHDGAEDVRARLETWIQAHVEGGKKARITSFDLPASSGLANRTALLELEGIDGPRATRALVARIGAAQTLYLDASLETQYLVCAEVAKLDGVPAPAAIAYEHDTSVLGAPFYLMDRVDGVPPPENPPFHRAGWIADLAPAARNTLWRDSVRAMARLHEAPSERFAFLMPEGVALRDTRRGTSDGLAHDLAYWRRYAAWALEGRHHAVVEQTMAWLDEHRPAERVTEFAWGDARMNNMLYRDGRCVAVLDWDTASLAGGESDLGWWAVMDRRQTSGLGIPRLEGIGTPRETIALWEELRGRKVRHLEFHLVYAAYRLALIRLRLPRLLAQADPTRTFNPTSEDDNVAVHYLRSMLALPSAGPNDEVWPGLD